MSQRRARGFTLVELIVTMAILALLVLAAVPMFGNAFVNSRIRGTGEAILTGIQLARSEAVSRNARVRFQLTSTLDGGCVLSNAGLNWVVNLDPNAAATEVEGRCNANPDDQVAPFILQTRPAASSGTTQVAATQPSLVFNGLGRLAEVPPGNVTIELTNPAAGACWADGGEVSCLRIVVSPAGQARMCNPDPALPAGDPRRC